MNRPAASAPASASAPRPPLLVWWVVWLALLGGVIVIYSVFLARRPPIEAPWGAIELVACGQVALSAAVRWLVLPRFREPMRAFPIFIIGMALAEGAAILGIFLSAYATELFVLGMVGMMQFVPFFAAKLLRPEADGFRPRG